MITICFMILVALALWRLVAKPPKPARRGSGRHAVGRMAKRWFLMWLW